MATIRLSVVGAIAPETAWERYADLALWPTWSPQIARVDASGPRLAQGVTGRVVARGGLRVPFEVLAVDEAAMRWTWRVRLGPVGMVLDHAVLPVVEGGARASLVLRGWGPVVTAYAPLARLALGRLVSSRA